MRRPEDERPSSLDSSTKLVRSPGWRLRLYPDAAEASGAFQYARAKRVRAAGPSENPDRSKVEATRRARGHVRRYCAANGLNRLGTLTYPGVGCDDPERVRVEVGDFFRRLRRRVGDGTFPYLWTTEWHPGGHGLHVHFAVGRFIKWKLIEEVWGRGFVWIVQVGSGRRRSAVLAESRSAARYLAKYVGKEFNASGSGFHRYEVAQGFAPRVREYVGSRLEEVVDEASSVMGARADYFSTSDEWENWFGPHAVFLSWNR